jgi:glycosyltransferase involved in cell wall biosynthesis
MNRPSVVIISSHPVVYHADFYKVLSQVDDIDFSVVFLDKAGRSGESELSVNLESVDIEKALYAGYASTTLKNYSLWPKTFFVRFLNPGIFLNASILRSDVVIVFGYANITLFLTTIYSYLLGKKIIFRGEGSIQKTSFLKEILKRIFLPNYFKLFDSFLYSFPKNKDYFKHYNVPDGRLFFAPSSVDSSRWQASKTEYMHFHQLRSNIKKGKIFVYLFCGVLRVRKNPFSLMNAFRSVVSKSGNAKLLVAGDGPLREDLEHWSETNNLSSKIVFLGSISEPKLREVYALSNVLVLPSDYDPSPKVLHECFACGIPAVVSDAVGTVGSFALDKVNSLVYPAGSVAELTAAMTLIKNDTVLLEKLKKNAFSATDQWSTEKTAVGFIDAINHILGVKK